MKLIFGSAHPKIVVYCENLLQLDFLNTEQAKQSINLNYSLETGANLETDQKVNWSLGLQVDYDATLISLDRIIAHNGNHWRKIFNIYAKIAKGIISNDSKTWQQYRDQELLQHDGSTLMVMSQYVDLNLIESFSDAIHLVMGKSYFQQVMLMSALTVVSTDTAKHHNVKAFKVNNINVINTPYFDYRQFNNLAIDNHIEFIKTLT